MEHLPKKTIENGIGYTLVGDYYIPDLQLPRKAVPLEFGAVCTKPIWSYTTQPGITT